MKRRNVRLLPAHAVQNKTRTAARHGSLTSAQLINLFNVNPFPNFTRPQSHISHMSHVGGLLCGLLPGLLVLPRLGSERWEAAWPALGALGVATWFAVLPAWVYAVRLPQAVLQCGAWP